MDSCVLVLIIMVLSSLFIYSESACTWPTPFRSSTWTDSTHGDLVFGLTSMTGYTYTIDGQTINDWSCVVADTFETDGRLIFLSNSSFTLHTVQFYAYLCMTFTQITGSSYRYYQNNEEKQFEADKYRILAYPVNSLTSPATICQDETGASGPEYQFIIKTGGESSAKIDCPYSSLGAYGYIHTDSSGTVTCDAENSSWDICSDNTQMTFSYSHCPTKVAYSATDTVWCVDTVPIGTTNYVMVFNGGESEATIDNIVVYRFACFAMSEDGSTASVTPQHCKAGQTTTDIPTDNSGIRIGATLQMTVKQNCSSCPVLTAPDRGFVTVSTEGAVTTATYECETNYTLSGTPQRVCQPNDSWTNTAPSCSCAQPPALDNGILVVSNDGYQANYTCNLGYSLKGLQIRQCLLATSKWEDMDPECVLCATIEPPPGGVPIYSSDGVTTMVKFTCDKGYTLSGLASLTCLTDGSWDEATPSCAKCPTLTNPISGSVSTSTDGLTTTAAYECAQLYELVGEPTLTCLDTGSWNHAPPICICQTPATPVNGTVVANGSIATYKCDLGYTINGMTSRTCRSDGTGWSSTDPKCSHCAVLDTPTGGSVTLSTDGIMTTAEYTCGKGYTLDGSSKILCRTDGTWNTVSTCVLCPQLQNPDSGIVAISTSGTVTSAIYSCVEGYILEGKTIRQCLDDGSWEFTEPTCSCLSPLSITNGVLSADGIEATYQCDIGYSLNGASTRTCQNDGSGWTGADPVCATCDTLANPIGGNITLSTDNRNTHATYRCETGYTLNGATTITCRSDGSWNFEQPTCVSCPSLTDPDSGTVVVMADDITTRATFSCVDGYYLSGVMILTCKTSGSWDNAVPTCKCNFPPLPLNGEVSVSDTLAGSVATYKCQNGFTLSGLSSRQCQPQGAGWQGSDPMCVNCDALTAPTFGQFAFSTNGIVTTATFQCDLYTSLEGERTLTCQTDGTWNNPIPSCVACQTLSNPSSGSITVSTDGATTMASFSCVTGYTLRSPGILTCQGDGTWNLPVPSCICTTPSSPTNGLVTLSNDYRLATYTCSSGYQLSGTSIRICLSDGTGWNGTEPICVEEPATTTTTEAPEGMISIHIGIVTVLCVIILLLVIILVVFAVLYLKVKKSRIGSSSERLVEEPEKPKILPEVAVPPNDTSHKKPPKHFKQTTVVTRTKRPPKLRKSLVSKELKRPTIEKSTTVLSASGINIEDSKLTTDTKDELNSNAEPSAKNNLLKVEKETETKQASPTTKKKQLSWNVPHKPQNDDSQNSNQTNTGIPTQKPSSDIPIFDDVKPVKLNSDSMEGANVNCEPASEVQALPNTPGEFNPNTARLSPILKPPVAHGFVLKRKRKRFGVKATSFKDDIREQRPRTPIEKRMRELGIDRIMTPDLLQQVAFNYIHPVFTHEQPDSERSGRDTAMSSRTFASYT